MPETKAQRLLRWEEEARSAREREKEERVYLNLMQLQKLNIQTFTGTRTAFLTLWHDKLREMNVFSDPEDFLPYSISRALLLRAVQSDPDLLQVFEQFNITGNYQPDFHVLCNALTNRAINTDNADSTKVTPSPLAVNQLDTSPPLNLTERDELEAYRAQFDRTLLFPMQFYSKISEEGKIALRKYLSDDDRRTLVSGMTTAHTSQSHTNPHRKAYAADQSGAIDNQTDDLSNELDAINQF